MHLADGTLSNTVCTVTAAVSIAAVTVAVARARAGVERETWVRVAAGAALVFAAQMIDVPLFGATAVHLVGAAFLTVLAGPALALLAMTAVLVVQALLFNDGGVAALGANVFTMGVVAVGVSALALRVTRRAGVFAGAAVASAASMVAACTSMATQLALSGTPAGDALALTMGAHAPFAAWETVITLALVVGAARLRVVKPRTATAGD